MLGHHTITTVYACRGVLQSLEGFVVSVGAGKYNCPNWLNCSLVITRGCAWAGSIAGSFPVAMTSGTEVQYTVELVIRRSEDSSTDVRWRATPVIECQFSGPDVLQSSLGPSVFRRDKTTTAVLTCPSLYSSVAPSSGYPPPVHGLLLPPPQPTLDFSLSLSMRPILYLSLFGRSRPLYQPAALRPKSVKNYPPQTILSNIATDL